MHLAKLCQAKCSPTIEVQCVQEQEAELYMQISPCYVSGPGSHRAAVERVSHGAKLQMKWEKTNSEVEKEQAFKSERLHSVADQLCDLGPVTSPL